jgi:hypothetical protein
VIKTAGRFKEVASDVEETILRFSRKDRRRLEEGMRTLRDVRPESRENRPESRHDLLESSADLS